MPSLFSLPVTCLTAAVQTTTTSWKTYSCESALPDFQFSRTGFDALHRWIAECEYQAWAPKTEVTVIVGKSQVSVKSTHVLFQFFFCSQFLFMCPCSCCLTIRPYCCTFSNRYVVSSLEMLVAEDYLIIYMNGATPRSKMPGISWLKKCYQMIDRRWEKEKLWRKYSNILIDMLCN